MGVVGSKGTDSAELEFILTQLENGKTPEDVFGVPVPPADVMKGVRDTYLKLQKIVHPDFFCKEHPIWDRVNKASAILNTMWDEAKKRIDQGIYGSNKVAAPKEDSPVVIQSRIYTYTLNRRIYTGGTCGVFEGLAQDKKGNVIHAVIKVPHSVKDVDLMDREAKNLGHIKTNTNRLKEEEDGEKKAENALMLIPRLLESVRLKDGKVINTFARIPGYESGWYTLEEIRNIHTKGVSSRVMTFIFNRVLEGLMLAHSAKVYHGAVTPHHVIIHAKKHLGNVIDWSSSCYSNTGTDIEKIPYFDKEIDKYSAPEVTKNRIPFQSSDVYSAAMSMLYVLGYDSETVEKGIDIEVEEPILEFLNKCIQPQRNLRFPTSAMAYREFRDVQSTVYGPRQFVELPMD